MFNNPLRKYASGGSAPSQQELEEFKEFVAWLPGKVKEFSNMSAEQIAQKVLELNQTPEGQQQVSQLLTMFRKEKTGATQFAKGGKLHDFICKHKKGGQVVGCGCNEDGGKVVKNQEPAGPIGEAPVYYYNEKGYPAEMNSITTRPNRMLYMEEATPRGKAAYMFNALQRNLPENMKLNFPVEYGVHTVNFLDDPEQSMAVHPVNGYMRDRFHNLKNQWTKKQENGGVVKGQSGLKEFPLTGTIAAVRPIAFAVQSSGDPRTQVSNDVVNKPDSNPLARFTDEQLAKAVIAGKYGYGASRRKFLGDRYNSVQRIVNKMLSKKTSTDAVTPASVANTPTATLPNASASSNTPKVLTSSSTIEPTIITATRPAATISSVNSAPALLEKQLYGSVPGGFIPQNTQGDSNFHINSNRPASSFGARQSIINRQYIDGAGLGIGTDIVFDNGRYIWKSSGAPVEVPMVGRNGNYRPAIERNGGNIKPSWTNRIKK